MISKNIGTPIDMDSAEFQEGESDYHDVIRDFGPPERLSALPDGMVFLYEHILISEKQLGISFNQSWLQWFKLSFARADADHQVLVLAFDKNGTLQAWEFRDRGERVGSGGEFQFFIVVKSLVDTSHLEDKKPYKWGTDLLRPLPQVLNRRQSPDPGIGGLEQRGTPARAGQRTLEMK